MSASGRTSSAAVPLARRRFLAGVAAGAAAVTGRAARGHEHVRAAGNDERLQRQRHLGRRLPRRRTRAGEDHRLRAAAAVQPVGHLLPAGRADDPADLEGLRPGQVVVRLPAQAPGAGRRAHRPHACLGGLRGQGWVRGSSREAVSYRGKAYGIPLYESYYVLFYSKPVFRRLGLSARAAGPSCCTAPKSSSATGSPRFSPARWAAGPRSSGSRSWSPRSTRTSTGGWWPARPRTPTPRPPGHGHLARLHAQGLDDLPDFDQARGPAR